MPLECNIYKNKAKEIISKEIINKVLINEYITELINII